MCVMCVCEWCVHVCVCVCVSDVCARVLESVVTHVCVCVCVLESVVTR